MLRTLYQVRRLFRAAWGRVVVEYHKLEIGRSGYFDKDWYSARYPDVQGLGQRALDHFVRHGGKEGRSPGPGFDAQRYLDDNPDVARAMTNPLLHFIRHGRQEGRQHFPVRDRLTPPAVRHRPAPPRTEPPRTVPDSIVLKVASQAKHDPSLFSPGSLEVISRLKVFRNAELYDRSGVDALYIRSALSVGADTVFLLPHLVVGGAEKYAADLTRELVEKMGHRVTVIVTLPRQHSLPDWFTYDILKPFRLANVVFWPEVCGPASGGPNSATFLARTLHALRPKNVVVVNSQLGLELVERFGKALSSESRLFTTYFSLGLPMIMTTGDLFARRTLAYAAAIADNERVLGQMAAYYGPPADRLVAIPALVRVADMSLFQARVERSIRPPGKRRRWLWYSRVEKMKASHVLGRLAQMRPSDEFVVYGPLQDSPEALGIDLPNIHLAGGLKDVMSADLSSFDGYVFTSLFEGLPNAVLEIAQHGLPMVLSDVGGLKETFSRDDVWFVTMDDNLEATAGSFSASLDEVGMCSEEEIRRRVYSSYRRVAQRHGAEAFEGHVLRTFGGAVRDA